MKHIVHSSPEKVFSVTFVMEYLEQRYTELYALQATASLRVIQTRRKTKETLSN